MGSALAVRKIEACMRKYEFLGKKCSELPGNLHRPAEKRSKNATRMIRACTGKTSEKKLTDNARTSWRVPRKLPEKVCELT